MSITKLPQNYQDGVVKDKRKYQIIHNQDDTVSIIEKTDFIRPEFAVNADMLNAVNDTVNQLIDLAEENASDVSDVDDDLDDVIDGTTKVKKATSASTATSATSAMTATTAESADNDFFLITRQRLNFSNNTVVFYDDRITADSLADIYFTEETANTAKQADISVTTDVIRATVTARNTPIGNIVATIKIRVV